jgi:hypothetical protein
LINMEVENQKVLTRQQLYNLVWTMPMVQLAKQFELSDNGLRKICKKYMIPIPKRGYWQKLMTGKPQGKVLLPIFKGKETISISPHIRENLGLPKKFEGAIVVSEHIEKFHPLIRQTQRLLAKGRDDRGRLFAGREGLDIRVSSIQLLRACRIMDTVIKTLEQLGVQVTIDEQEGWRPHTYANIEGEKVYFGLDEPYAIGKKVPDKYGSSRQEYNPTGELALSIKDHYLGGCRARWADGKNSKIEEKIASFIDGLFVAAAYLKKQRQEREVEKHRWEEEQRERERKSQELKEEKRRLQVLEQQAMSWQKGRLIRVYIRARIKKQGTYVPDSNFGKWVAWATDYANRLDPLERENETA